mgnify:CR=1 FL=1
MDNLTILASIIIVGIYIVYWLVISEFYHLKPTLKEKFIWVAFWPVFLPLALIYRVVDIFRGEQ